MTPSILSDSQRNALSLLLIFLLMFSEGVNNTVPNAILPTEAASKGISQSVVGLLIGAHSLSICVFTIPLLTLIQPEQTKLVFVLGSITSGSFCVLFGELVRINNATVFICWSLLVRIILGIGKTMIWASVTSLALRLYTTKPGTIYALLQTAIATGQLSGAPVASLLFSIGGYPLPYEVTGLTQCLLALLFLFIFPSFSDSTAKEPNCRPGPQTRIFKFFSCWGIVVTTPSALFVSAFMGFLNSAFAPYLLNAFDIGPSESGIYFIPYSFTDAFSALVYGRFVDAGYSGIVYTLGTSVHTAALLVISFPLFFPSFVNMLFLQINLAVSGLCFQAIATSGFSIFKMIALRSEVDSQAHIEILCSSWVCLSFSVGKLLGQGGFGGVLFQYLSFYTCCLIQSIIGFTTLVITVSYFTKHGLFRDATLRANYEAVGEANEKARLIE